jgi:hypothetical protein
MLAEANDMDPQVIAMIGAFVFILWFPTLTLVAVLAFRRLRLQERLKAIEHGRDLIVDAGATAARTRRSGIVLIAGGAGIAVAALIVAAVSGDHETLVFLAAAAVPLFVGGGVLIDYRLQLRDMRRAEAEPRPTQAARP